MSEKGYTHEKNIFRIMLLL